MMSMLLSIFTPKERFLRFWPKKCGKVRFGALFAPNALFALFAPKGQKRAWARNVALDNAFLCVLEAIFAKKRERADF